MEDGNEEVLPCCGAKLLLHCIKVAFLWSGVSWSFAVVICSRLIVCVPDSVCICVNLVLFPTFATVYIYMYVGISLNAMVPYD